MSAATAMLLSNSYPISAFKFISDIKNRKIIVRDSSRFHHFEMGSVLVEITGKSRPQAGMDLGFRFRGAKNKSLILKGHCIKCK